MQHISFLQISSNAGTQFQIEIYIWKALYLDYWSKVWNTFGRFGIRLEYFILKCIVEMAKLNFQQSLVQYLVSHDPLAVVLLKKHLFLLLMLKTVFAA